MQDACNKILAISGMHVLAGLSPDNSVLFVVFAPLSMLTCVAQAESCAS
jgi:hypothetical protein